MINNPKNNNILKIKSLPKTDLPKDFNWKTYLKMNPDLDQKNKKNAIEHYLKYGIFENRMYKINENIIPKDFNWKEYIKINDDLKDINNEIEALNHYIKYGINEKRQYKIHASNNITNTIDNSINYDFINDNEILYTKQFFKQNENFLKYTLNINILKTISSFVLIVDFNNGGGGTTIFLNRIVSKYKNYNTFLILRFNGEKYNLNLNEEYIIDIELNNLEDISKLLEEHKARCKKIFVNHLIGFDDKFIKYILNFDVTKIGITHDYYNIFESPQPTFKEIKNSIRNSIIDINKYDVLITQNQANLNIFSKYYKKKIDVIELPDFKYKEKLINTSNTKINCCIIGNINKIKGSKQFEKILKYFNSNYPDINFSIIGYINDNFFKNYQSYNTINEFNNLLMNYKPNLIIELTIWPETYSYTLSLSMLTELPILYLKKPDDSVIKDRLKKYSKSYEFDSMSTLYSLIQKYSQNYFYTINPTIVYKKYWNDLFIYNTNKITKNIKQKFIYDIKPYFIYFPQFHEIYENNINFYKDFSDVKNLKFLNESQVNKQEMPLKEYCDIDNYDYILNTKLMQKQIDLINHYGFSGLAIYYYWFSVNSYTNKNMIMNNVIDKFFTSTLNMYDRKVFFIWANENWMNNAALNPCNNNKEIKNIYDNESFEKNSENLVKYFKHENYLKIENKPVFFIYHTYLIDKIDDFYDTLNNICKQNNFDGVHLVLNSFEKEYVNYKNFYINFNYKIYDSRFFDNNDNQIKLDYRRYMNDPYHFKKNKIHTIVFDFNNKARLYIPDQIKKSTKCINNNEFNKTVMTKKIIETYKNEEYCELDKILLVNSLNEWGENMIFEPSDKYGYYNINLLYQLL